MSSPSTHDLERFDQLLQLASEDDDQRSYVDAELMGAHDLTIRAVQAILDRLNALKAESLTEDEEPAE